MRLVMLRLQVTGHSMPDRYKRRDRRLAMDPTIAGDELRGKNPKTPAMVPALVTRRYWANPPSANKSQAAALKAKAPRTRTRMPATPEGKEAPGSAMLHISRSAAKGLGDPLLAFW